MRKAEIKYLVILVALFAGFILFEVYRTKPIDWTPSLSNKDKVPYGTHVLYSQMDELFPGQKVTESRLPAYNFLLKDSSLQAHYISITNQLQYDDNDIDALLDFAAAGNSVFIASQYMYLPQLLDTLHIQVRDTLTFTLRDSLKVWTRFTNSQLNTQAYFFQRKVSNAGFFEFDSLTRATVLGRNSLGGPDFVSTPFGQGTFYLHLSPLAFSNYYVLNDTTSDYAFKALSYLPPDRAVVWDEYVKQGRVGEKNIMYVVMQHAALRWTYYITIFGILLFVLFEGKRRQRVIPIVTPLRNTTLEFVGVVSRLYFQKQDHKGIAHKKIIFFLEHIRSQYHLPTNKLDEEFVDTLSHKSGYSLDKTKYLIWKIRQVAEANHVTAEDLVKLSGEMEEYREGLTPGPSPKERGARAHNV